MRITNSIIFNTAIENLQNQNQQLFRIQEEAASGKKILRLSDEPVSVQHIFNFRQKLASINQFQENQDHINSFLGTTEAALQGVESLLHRAQELTLSGLSDALNDKDRMTIAQEVNELIGQAVQLGNTEFAGRFIFAGTAEQSEPPFSDTGQFSGNSQEFSLEIAPDQTLPMNIVGAQFLTSDLRPDVDLSTLLSSLQDGQGLSSGSVRVTDRAGNSAVIDLSTATTIDDILTAISNAPGLNVTATINAEGNGIAIMDNHASPTQNLTIEEVGGGTTAKELGILADRSSDIVGTPLHPAVAPSTPLALLYEGQGMVPSTVRITNGAVEVEIDLSSALTIDDIITTINAAGVNVTASINAESTALDVRSNDASTVAIVTDIAGGTTAADLGIQGGRDVLKTLQRLEEALQRDDLQALNRLLTQLDSGLTQVLNLRSEVGARLNRVQLAQEQNVAKELAVTLLLSQTQDADAVETFSRLTQQSFAFEAALASTAEMIQPTLLDFLR